jgi:hypothetical protein
VLFYVILSKLGNSVNLIWPYYILWVVTNVACLEYCVQLVECVYWTEPKATSRQCKNQPNAYNMYTNVEGILSDCLYLHLSFYPMVVNFCKYVQYYVFPNSTGKIQIYRKKPLQRILRWPLPSKTGTYSIICIWLSFYEDDLLPWVLLTVNRTAICTNWRCRAARSRIWLLRRPIGEREALRHTAVVVGSSDIYIYNIIYTIIYNIFLIFGGCTLASLQYSPCI